MLTVFAIAASSCTALALERSLHVPPRLVCPDGAPVQLLEDPSCRGGICGWTCEPDRWAQTAPR